MKREVKIGIFLAFVFIIMAVSVFVLGKVGRVFVKGGYSIEAVFDSVAGLDRRAVVRIGGVRVGFVEDIALEGNRPVVLLKITRRDVRVPADSQATLAALGMLGEKYIEILPGLSDMNCPPGGRLSTKSSVGLDEVGGLVVSIGGEIKEVGNAIRELVSEGNRDRVESTLESLASLTSGLDDFLRENRGNLKSGLKDASQAARDANSAIQDVSQDLRGSASALRGLLDDNRGLVKSNLEKVQELLREIEGSVKRLNETLDKLNKGEGTLGHLLQDPVLYEKTEQTIDGVRKTVGALGALDGELDVRSEYYGQSGLFKGGLGFRLWLAGRNLVETRVTHDPWRDGFNYSLQVGRRFGPLSPRVGIIESDFGLGLDGEFLNRRLRLSLDSFAFNREAGPRFRLSSRLFPVGSLYLVLGVDDFSLSANREFYFGLGVEAR